MSKPLKVTASGRRIVGDAVYSITATVDMTALLRIGGERAAGKLSGRALAFGSAVVVTAKQANVARGRK